jgi:hypothetical protein
VVEEGKCGRFVHVLRRKLQQLSCGWCLCRVYTQLAAVRRSSCLRPHDGTGSPSNTGQSPGYSFALLTADNQALWCLGDALLVAPLSPTSLAGSTVALRTTLLFCMCFSRSNHLLRKCYLNPPNLSLLT